MRRLKAAVVRWRGGVRYGGARLVVSGKVESEAMAGAAGSLTVLRAAGSNQRFVLRSGPAGCRPEELPQGKLLRVTARVAKGSEANDDDIGLELERVESDRPPP
jgi:hypothetical protein